MPLGNSFYGAGRGPPPARVGSAPSHPAPGPIKRISVGHILRSPGSSKIYAICNYTKASTVQQKSFRLEAKKPCNFDRGLKRIFRLVKAARLYV